MTRNTPPFRIAIAGCTGRMGLALLRMGVTWPGCALVAASVRPGHACAGEDIGMVAGLPRPLGIHATENMEAMVEAAEAVIDFTTPEHSLALAEHIAAKGKILVIGTTGFSEEQKKKLAHYAKCAVIVYSANMSLGVNLLAALVEKAAKALGDEYRISIFDHHHRHKKDSPSGTALMLGEASARAAEDITYKSERSGEVVGDHVVTFSGPGENIMLGHHAATRDIFAAGALKAALWARGQKPGLYSLRDVLGV